jgi:hypothetical protein
MTKGEKKEDEKGCDCGSFRPVPDQEPGETKRDEHDQKGSSQCPVEIHFGHPTDVCGSEC